MAKKSKRPPVNIRALLASPARFKRTLIFGVAVLVAGLGIFGVHQVSPQPVREKIESVTLDVIDVVRESRAAPAELVVWLDLVADKIPLMHANAVAPGSSIDEAALVLGGTPAARMQLTVLKNTGYIVGYDEAQKNPAWVAYRVFPARYPTNKRPDGFEVDMRTRERVESKAYSNSGYDRGHMAPNHAIAVCYGADAQRETFLMSNVVPQKHGLNGAFWEAMERRVISRYTRRFGDVWVICGPIYDAAKPSAKLRSGVAVPDAFFLIVAEKSSAGVSAQAFVVPHKEIKETANPNQFLASVRDIETKTGLNFFPQFSKTAQEALETKTLSRAW